MFIQLNAWPDLIWACHKNVFFPLSNTTVQKRACNTATCVTHRLADFLSRSGGLGHSNFVPTNVGAQAFGRRKRGGPVWAQADTRLASASYSHTSVIAAWPVLSKESDLKLFFSWNQDVGTAVFHIIDMQLQKSYCICKAVAIYCQRHKAKVPHKIFSGFTPAHKIKWNDYLSSLCLSSSKRLLRVLLSSTPEEERTCS